MVKGHPTGSGPTGGGPTGGGPHLLAGQSSVSSFFLPSFIVSVEWW